MAFDFQTAGRITFGEGTLAASAKAIRDMGRRGLLVTSGWSAADPRVAAFLDALGVEMRRFEVMQEPSVDIIAAGLEAVKTESVDFIVALGGGSVIDAAKAIGGLATSGGELLDYLEVVGRGKPLLREGLPVAAIPTTSGTGAEVTRNAVIGVPEKQVKVSLRSPYLLPRLAVVDPELTHTLPPAITASTGMDALTQVIEPYLSRKANPMTDLYCREGIARAGRSLLRAYLDGADRAARLDMSFASLMGGLALANAGLGAVHGFAGVLGGMYAAPHGAICARLLPEVVQQNDRVMRARGADPTLLARFSEAARLATGVEDADAADLLEWLRDLCARMEIPPLRAYGIAHSDFTAIVEKAQQASSMKANPVQLDDADLHAILERAW